VHAYGVAALLGSPSIIVPPGAGVASAIGFLTAPLSFEFVQGWYARLSELDWTQVNAFLDDMERQGRTLLSGAGLPDAEIGVWRSCDLRYEGQGSDVNVPVPAARGSTTSGGRSTSGTANCTAARCPGRASRS
jgi:N-methylhydantoinase A